MMIFFLLIPIALFILLFFYERRTIWLGFFFVLTMVYLLVLALAYFETSYQQLTLTIVLLFSIIFVVPIPFYIFSFIIALISSGLRLIKHEGKKLHNFLSLALGIFIIAWSIGINFIKIPETAAFLFSAAFFITTTILYLYILMFSFVVSALLNRLRNPFKTYDYIIVLGSGLIGDRVPPLLASRIDKGIALFHRFNQINHPVKLIFTGGQGEDESLPEGLAMANDAITKGIRADQIIIEDKAVNTYQNLLFSKRLIDQDWKATGQTRQPKIIIATNNFHVFRSLLWARKVGFKCEGAGAKTKFYFWLNALIREFIGVLFMQRKFHLFAIGSIFLGAIAMYFIQKFAVIPYL